MLEAYVVITLGALGYMLNSMNNNVKPTKKEVHKNESPSMETIYESRYVQKADAMERQRAAKAYEDSKTPEKTNVISRNYPAEKSIKSLTGDLVSEEEFRHNNMIPFFGSHVRQNLDENSNRMILENFTGIGDLQRNKCETKSFYDKAQDNIYGMQDQTDYYKERIIAPTARKNEFPIPQQRVGPGLNQGYTTGGTGGFHQFEARDYAQDKCVDELRVKSKPKITYEGRVLPGGLAAGLPGKTGQLAKNRVETFYEQSPDMYLKTKAAVLKQSQVPSFNVKNTNRIDTTKEYQGTAYTNRARRADASTKPTSRQQLDSYGIRNAILSILGLGEKYDYGKSNVIVYNNERDLTTTKTYQGNVQALVKAIIAPIEDMIKITKKQETVQNPREYGYLAPQMPNKPTMHDPSDTAKTTIKETTIHDAILGNLKGSEKITVHDPDDVARTTVKETNIHDSVMGNLKPAGPERTTVYDPNDVARTTIKETLIHDEIGTGTLTGPKELYVYDPDEVAKTTIRETLERMDYELNIAPNVNKGKVYDPDDVARATLKETLIDGERYGNADRVEGGGAYETTDYNAKQTQKAFLSDIDHYGIGTRNKGEGYITNDMEAKQTQKSFLSDYEYYGHAESANEKKMMSYEDYENASITPNKETTLFGREPKGSGVKSFNNCVNIKFKKPECDSASARQNNTNDRVYNEIPTLNDNAITKNRLSVDLDIGDRLDIGLLDALKDNPYARTLGAVA